MRPGPCLRTTLLLLTMPLSLAAAAMHPGAGIVVDRHGNVYFVVLGSNAIMRLSPDGSVAAFVTDERLSRPHHLVLGRDGSLYAASDHDGRVWRVSADGSLQEHLNSNRVPAQGGTDVQIGAWGNPFTVDSDGNVYATHNLSSIIRVSLDGSVAPIASSTRFGDLHSRSMTLGPDGALYLTDAGRVWRIVGDSATAIVPRDTRLSYPMGIAVDSQRNVYVADYGEGRIVRFALDGSVNTPGALRRLRLRSPTGVTISGADVHVLDSPPGGVAIWRVRGDVASRLYSRMSPAAYTRRAFPWLLALLLGLIAWRATQRLRKRATP